jgi:uracil-DNA glycosylase
MSIIYLPLSEVNFDFKEAQLIAVQVPCVATPYPKAYDDIFSYQLITNDPGTIKIVKDREGKKCVAMYCQINNGPPYDPDPSMSEDGGDIFTQDTSEDREEYFRLCLDRIMNIKKIKSIAFPYGIGCSVTRKGGFRENDWKTYEKSIQEFATINEHIQVYIYGKIYTKRDVSFVIHTSPLSLDNKDNNDKGDNNDNKDDVCKKATLSLPIKEGISVQVKIHEQHADYKDGLSLIILFWMGRYTALGWGDFFSQIFKTPNSEYKESIITKIDNFLKEDALTHEIFPAPNEVFNAFTYVPLKDIHVVIIGQDCYHTPGAAMGLAFSHNDGYGKVQPSLQNIHKELIRDGYKVDTKSGSLVKWAEQGVFLINTALTVRKGEPNSHSKVWQDFSKEMFEYLTIRSSHLVVIMWGSYAQKFESIFKKGPPGCKRIMLKSVHPSPMSVHLGFENSKPFSKTNALLKKWGLKEIDWNLG